MITGLIVNSGLAFIFALPYFSLIQFAYSQNIQTILILVLVSLPLILATINWAYSKSKSVDLINKQPIKGNDSNINEQTVNDLCDEINELKSHHQAAISDLKAANITIKNDHLYISSILDNAVDAIITINNDGNITSFNQAALTLFQYSIEEVIGLNVAILIPEADRDEYQQYIVGYKQSQKSTVLGKERHLNGQKKDGTHFPIRLAISAITCDEKPGFCGIINDLSIIPHGESNLVIDKEKAEKANLAKSELLSSMSHELRTPLNSISGFAQLLEADNSSPLNEEQLDNVHHILSSCKHLLGLINEILDLAKIESGKFALSIEATHSRALLNDCIKITESLAIDNRIKVVDKTPKALPDLLVDHLRAKQAILNILSNAVKYNREQGNIFITSEVKDNTWVLTIQDTGVGIADNNKEKVFEPFSRLDHEDSLIEGTGIGLAITKRIIEAMGGSISFDSTLNEGSSFWIDFPIAKSTELKETNKRADHQPSFDTSITPVKSEKVSVLYIEDNPANVRLMENIIARINNIELISTHTAELGIALARDSKPKLIILDINLPGMSGLEAAIHLKANEITKDIPLIALSANAMPSDVKHGMESNHFLHYLTKPFEIPKFIDIINKVLF